MDKNDVIITLGLKQDAMTAGRMAEVHNNLITSGQQSVDTQEVENALSQFIFSPIKALVLATLDKEKKVSEERDNLRKEKEIFVQNSPLLKFIPELREALKLPSGKILKTANIQKKVNNKWMELGYLPGDIRGFYNPLSITTENCPTSVLRLVVRKGEETKTGKIPTIINLVSIVYNEYTNKYDEHRWQVTYNLVDGADITTTVSDAEIEDYENVCY